MKRKVSSPMKRLVYFGIVCSGTVLCGMVMSTAVGQPSAAPGGAVPVAQVRPRQPGGLLGDSLGSYLTIEGVLDEGKGKVESNTLMVDTLDGKKLGKPVSVLIRNVRLPAKERCVLKGYELGEMIGRAPAEYAAAREQGQDAEELAKRDQTVWRWRPYFVVLIAVSPEGLDLRKP